MSTKSDMDAYYEKKLTALPDSDLRVFARQALPAAPNSFHIIGICGTAMGALAGLLLEKGYKVSGSDTACYPPISTMLEHMAATTYIGDFSAEHIGTADIVVVGNVARPTNPEATYAREHKLPQATLPEVLRTYIFGDATRLVVAGTHGKTTTTGLLTHVFIEAGKQPGYMIGGIPQGHEHGYALGAGAYALFEGDEYDTSYYNKMPKFLQYGAHTGIVTSLELDHVDIYDSYESYRQAFAFFAQSLPREGYLFLNADHQAVRELATMATATVYTYSTTTSDATYYAKIHEQDGPMQVADIYKEGVLLGTIETPLSGTYNVGNILAVIGVALTHGITFDVLQRAIPTFTGMKRRQEVLAEIHDVTLIDDFAHHPTAVAETLAGIKKKYAGRRLLVLFEPRSNSSRKKVFEDAYIQSFTDANFAWIKVPPFREGDIQTDSIDAHHVAEMVTVQGVPMYVATDGYELVQDVLSQIRSGDVVVTMSNGSFDGVPYMLRDALKGKQTL